MTKERASELVSENLTAIYGFAFARLYDKGKVDDLTSEIVCEILASVKNLENDEAFWGFAWRIADNTFRKFIKREELRGRVERYSEEEVTGAVLSHEKTPEAEYIQAEEQDAEVYLLRRELSLLAKAHREVCVAYYADNKSCSEIAEELNLSLEMVKYHLFKTRKLLKEGIGMTRKLGEKSYNPGVFELGFWGDTCYYTDLFKRKLPGSILLAAYYTPLSMEELSMELGVAVPYLEEEVEILEAAEVLVKNGSKYQTNLVILTEAYEKEAIRETSGLYGDSAKKIFGQVSEVLPKVRELSFLGNKYDDNRLLFALINIANVLGYEMSEEKLTLGEGARLALGGTGWLFGVDNHFKNTRMNAVCLETENMAGTAWFSAANYVALEAYPRYLHNNFLKKAEVMCAAVLNEVADRENETLPELIEEGFISCKEGVLSANFPVFTAETYKEIGTLLQPAAELVCECMLAAVGKAEKILKDHAPAAVRSQCGAIAKIHYRLDVIGNLMDKLIEEKLLTLPSEQVPLTVWGVRA